MGDERTINEKWNLSLVVACSSSGSVILKIKFKTFQNFTISMNTNTIATNYSLASHIFDGYAKILDDEKSNKEDIIEANAVLRTLKLLFGPSAFLNNDDVENSSIEEEKPHFHVGQIVRINEHAAQLHVGYHNGYSWLPFRDEYVGHLYKIDKIGPFGSVKLHDGTDDTLWNVADLEDAESLMESAGYVAIKIESEKDVDMFNEFAKKEKLIWRNGTPASECEFPFNMVHWKYVRYYYPGIIVLSKEEDDALSVSTFIETYNSGMK